VKLEDNFVSYFRPIYFIFLNFFYFMHFEVLSMNFEIFDVFSS
jgi:hypothetical protein